MPARYRFAARRRRARCGIGQLVRVRHRLIQMIDQRPIARFFRLLVCPHDSIAHEREHAMEPFGPVYHIHHNLLEAAQIRDLRGYVAVPHTVFWSPVGEYREDVAENLRRTSQSFGSEILVDDMVWRDEL